MRTPGSEVLGSRWAYQRPVEVCRGCSQPVASPYSDGVLLPAWLMAGAASRRADPEAARHSAVADRGRPVTVSLPSGGIGSVQVAGAGERFIQGHTKADLGRCGCCTLLLHLLG